MSEISVFVAAIWAQKETDSGAQISPGIIFAADLALAEQRALATAFELFPASEGWGYHGSTCIELPEYIVLEGYQLEWQIKPVLPEVPT